MSWGGGDWFMGCPRLLVQIMVKIWTIIQLFARCWASDHIGRKSAPPEPLDDTVCVFHGVKLSLFPPLDMKYSAHTLHAFLFSLEAQHQLHIVRLWYFSQFLGSEAYGCIFSPNSLLDFI